MEKPGTKVGRPKWPPSLAARAEMTVVEIRGA